MDGGDASLVQKISALRPCPQLSCPPTPPSWHAVGGSQTVVRKPARVKQKSGSLFWWRVTHRVLAELFIGSGDPSLFSPADKHLGVRHHYSYEVGLARPKHDERLGDDACEKKKEASNSTPNVVTRAPTCKLSPCTNTCSTGTQRVYTFSIFSGAMYSPCDSLKMCFFRSMMRRVPF